MQASENFFCYYKIMSKIHFETKPFAVNSWVIIKLPEGASVKLPSRGQVMSDVYVNGKTFQVVLEPDGRGGHWFKVTDDMHAEVGDTVSVEIEPTKEWPEPELPKDFEKALSNIPEIHTFFKKITPMAKWEWIRWINSTNVTATREKRIEVSIDKLKKGMRRPCCFNRAACTQPEVSKNAMLIESVQVMK
jgi:hypothetical protein